MCAPLFFQLAVAVVACNLALASGKAENDPKLELVTFNAGLLPTLPYTSERFSLLAEKLRELSADLVCLQEVWTESDQLAVIHATQSEFPYHVRMKTHASATPPCDNEALSAALECARTRCPSSKLSMKQLQCAFQKVNCGDKFANLGQRCINCIVLSPSLGSSGHPESCSADTSTSYSTTHGILLLSKRRFIKSEATNFTDTDLVQLITRGYLSAEIENVGTIVCTHFPTYYFAPDEPYIGPPMYNDVLEEQNGCTKTLFDTFLSKSITQPVIFTGDFNHGPAIGETVAAEYPEGYQAIIDRGYVSAFVTQGGQCTYCTDNSVASSKPAEAAKESPSLPDMLIDHIYCPSKMAADITEAKRIFTSSTSFGFHLSDHYGISVSYKLKDSHDSTKSAFQEMYGSDQQQMRENV